MRNRLELKTNADLESRYKGLLRDEGQPLLERSLELLDDQLRLSGAAEVLPRNGTARKPSSIPSLSDLLTNELLPLLRGLHSGDLPPVPKIAVAPRPDRQGQLFRAAIGTAIALTVQSRFEVHGAEGLFRDVQSLVFLATIDELLPALKSARLDDLHNLLVNVLAYHATVVWRDDVAQQQYLLGALAGYSGDEELERKSLIAAFRMTNPGEHDYLTKAQACLFHFLELRRYDEARSFLLGVYRQAPPEALSELGEMLDDVYLEETAGKRKGRKVAR